MHKTAPAALFGCGKSQYQIVAFVLSIECVATKRVSDWESKFWKNTGRRTEDGFKK